jgi:hypothetical protein
MQAMRPQCCRNACLACLQFVAPGLTSYFIRGSAPIVKRSHTECTRAVSYPWGQSLLFTLLLQSP